MASISSSLHGKRWKRVGNSWRSKNSPFWGLIGPRLAPGAPPIAPYAEEAEARPGVFKGPCCWALDRYVAKESGRLWEGDAGWACGVWSTDAIELIARLALTLTEDMDIVLESDELRSYLVSCAFPRTWSKECEQHSSRLPWYAFFLLSLNFFVCFLASWLEVAVHSIQRGKWSNEQWDVVEENRRRCPRFRTRSGIARFGNRRSFFWPSVRRLLDWILIMQLCVRRDGR